MSRQQKDCIVFSVQNVQQLFDFVFCIVLLSPTQFSSIILNLSSFIIYDFFTCWGVPGYIYGTSIGTFLGFIFAFWFLIKILRITSFFKNSLRKASSKGRFYVGIVKICFSVKKNNKKTVVCTAKYKFISSFSVILH